MYYPEDRHTGVDIDIRTCVYSYVYEAAVLSAIKVLPRLLDRDSHEMRRLPACPVAVLRAVLCREREDISPRVHAYKTCALRVASLSTKKLEKALLLHIRRHSSLLLERS